MKDGLNTQEQARVLRKVMGVPGRGGREEGRGRQCWKEEAGGRAGTGSESPVKV